MLGLITTPEQLAHAFQAAEFGSFTLNVTLACSVFFFLLTGIGVVRRDERFVSAARKGQYALFLLTALAAAVLWYMIFEGLYVSTYVNNVTEEHEEFFYKVVALWASQQGSLLFWCLVLNFCGVAFAWVNRHSRTDRRLPYTLLALFAVQTFFLALFLMERSNPFASMLWWMNGDLSDLTLGNLYRYYDWLSLREQWATMTPEARISEMTQAIVAQPEGNAQIDALRWALERANFSPEGIESLRAMVQDPVESWPQQLVTDMQANNWTPEFMRQLATPNDWDVMVRSIMEVPANSVDALPPSRELFHLYASSRDSTIAPSAMEQSSALWLHMSAIEGLDLQTLSHGNLEWLVRGAVWREMGIVDWAHLPDQAAMTISAAREALLTDPMLLGENFTMEAITRWQDGAGGNPQLHNYWIAVHPPTLYLGYIGFTIPFCYAVGSLMSGELGGEWIRKARLWTMTAWTLLGAGIAMGGLWAYEILGWGGYWAWDPVENASFIPWLFATAFIHSVIVQERRGMLKVWNVVLIILTYCMTVIGTFLVRSGIIDSVHAFGDTGLKWPLLGFLIVVLLVPLLLTVWRRPLLRPERKLESVFSREAVFLFNNVVLCLIALTTLAMTFWPAITEFFFEKEGKQQFGADAFTLINGPLFLLLLTFTACGPLLPYGKASKRELLKQFKKPVITAAVVFAINAALLFSRGWIKSLPEGGDNIQTGVAMVRVLVQFALPSICAMIIASVVQELMVPARARKRSTKQSLAGAAFSVFLGNRRRYGGYICHIGIALLAMGIYISSYYDVDTSAKLPEGGYALLGDDGDWVVVNDGSAATELFRDVREQDPIIRKTLLAMNLLNENPELSEDELKAKVRSTVRIPGGDLSTPVRNAISSFQRDPKLTPEDQFASIQRRFEDMAKEGSGSPMPGPEQQARMQSGLYRAFDLVNLTDENIQTARNMLADSRAMEYYQTTIRAYPYTAGELSEEQVLNFIQARERFKLGVRSMSPEARAAIRPTDHASFAALQSSRAWEPLMKLTYDLAPEVLLVLNSIENDADMESLDLERLTNAIIRTGLFDYEENRSAQLARTLAAGDNAQAQEEFDHLGWRALGGLRRVASEDDGNAKAFAEAQLERLRSTSGVVKPRIETFYNKRTGEPRRMGEDVRNPRITRYPTEDVYLILQGVEFGVTPDEDVAILRVFIKPAMNLGLLGLGIMILGAVLAMLPKRRRLPTPTQA